MRENKAKQKLREGGSVLAVTLNFVHAGMAEYLGQLGFDIIIADGEHAPTNDNLIEEFTRACELSGASPVMRLSYDAAEMERCLAIGVHGFHIAGVGSSAHARRVVDAVKYHPLGKRGFGNYRAMDFGVTLGSWPDFIERANANTFIKIIVEDAKALEELPQIAGLPEIDVIELGRHDLSASLGVPGDLKNPIFLEAHKKGTEIVKASGRTLGVPVNTGEHLKREHANGARYFLVSLSRVLVCGSADFLSAMRELR